METTLNFDLFKFAEDTFTRHLTYEANNRIFFSGKFGAGKTSFLKHFFGESGTREIGKTKYEAFHLYPVNYSISSTQDIIELIKYDIVLELLQKRHIEVYENDIDSEYLFLKSQYDKIFSTLLAAIPQVGKDVSEVFDKIMELRKSYQEHHTNTNKQINEGDTLATYLQEIEAKTGMLYESNVISTIIERVLNRYSSNAAEGKEIKSILIIDDLDRIDPEHLFRILNVFAAHFDTPSKTMFGKNKFGFDTVVVVADINNVRRIFKNRYGQDVDFSGYIDKFYSSEVFNYRSAQELYDFFYKRVKNITINKTEVTRLTAGHYLKQITDLLALLEDHDGFSLRKAIKVPSNIDLNYHLKIEDRAIDLDEEPAIVSLAVLITFLGGSQNALQSIQNLKRDKVPIAPVLPHLAHFLFYLYTRSEHKFSKNNNPAIIRRNSKNTSVRAIITRSDFRNTYEIIHLENTAESSVPVTFENDEVYDYLLDAVAFFAYKKFII